MAGDSERGDSYLGMVSQFIEDSQQAAFEGNWMMLVNYDEVPPYSPFSIPILVSPLYVMYITESMYMHLHCGAIIKQCVTV